MLITEINEVCRLCLTTENLVSILNKELENHENMKNVIYVTTGVKVRE